MNFFMTIFIGTIWIDLCMFYDMIVCGRWMMMPIDEDHYDDYDLDHRFKRTKDQIIIKFRISPNFITFLSFYKNFSDVNHYECVLQDYLLEMMIISQTNNKIFFLSLLDSDKFLRRQPVEIASFFFKTLTRYIWFDMKLWKV